MLPSTCSTEAGTAESKLNSFSWLFGTAGLFYWIASFLETAVNGGCVVVLLGLVGLQVEVGMQPAGETGLSWALLEQAADIGP